MFKVFQSIAIIIDPYMILSYPLTLPLLFVNAFAFCNDKMIQAHFFSVSCPRSRTSQFSNEHWFMELPLFLRLLIKTELDRKYFLFSLR